MKIILGRELPSLTSTGKSGGVEARQGASFSIVADMMRSLHRSSEMVAGEGFEPSTFRL